VADPRAVATPIRESPLQGRGPSTLVVRNATIVERPFRAMLDVRADASDAKARDALLEATGLCWPPSCRFEARDGCTLAWLGPDEFLLIDDTGAGDAAHTGAASRASRADVARADVEARDAGSHAGIESHDDGTRAGIGSRDDTWRASLGPGAHAVTAVGAGHTTLEVSGPGTLDLLASGCALDVHPQAFRAGDCLGTMFAATAVTLLHRGATGDGSPRIEMLVRRSYADHVWRWLAAHG